MKSPTDNQIKSLVILRTSDKDVRRTSTSTLRTKFNRSTFATGDQALLWHSHSWLCSWVSLLSSPSSRPERRVVCGSERRDRGTQLNVFPLLNGGTSGFLFAAIRYLIASYRLRITDY
jgi:hypothetical protein